MNPFKLLKFLLVDFLSPQFGGGNDSQTVTQRTEVPDFLKPLTKQSAAITGRALSQLEPLLTGGTRTVTNLPEGAVVQNGRVMMPRPRQPGQKNFGQPQMMDLGPVSQFRTRVGTGGDPNLVADFDPLETQAQQLAIDRALGADGFLPTFQDELLSTARGDFLFGGQGFDEALEAAKRRVMPQILSTFGKANALDGGLAQEAIAQAISDSFAGLFNQERGRQLQALGALPSAATADVDILSRIGAARRGITQNQIDAPITALERWIAATQGNIPATSMFGRSETTPLHSNPLAGALGGGLAGASLMTGPLGFGLANMGLTSGAMLPWGAAAGPVGAIGGAILGGLLS